MAAAPAVPAGEATRRGWPVWLLVLAVLLVALAGYGVYARAQGPSAALATTEPGEQLREEQVRGTSLAGVGRARGLDLPCTAWLLDAGAAAGSEAYAVTAGRCVGIDDSATVVSERPLSGATVDFRPLVARSGDPLAPVTVPVSEVAWASTRGTDLAVLRLDATYQQLAALGIRPIRPAPALAEGGQVLVAGVPVEGLGADQQYLRGSRCAVGAVTDVAEQPWLFRDLQASGCAGILEGSAGSPALNPAGQAVGMVNTSTIGAEPVADCAAGRPCEIDEGSVEIRADTSYLVAVDGLVDCFPGGVLDTGAACPLEDPDTVVVASLGSTVADAGERIEVVLADPSPPVPSVATGMLGDVDCWGPDRWRVPIVTEAGSLVVPAPARQGLAVVCVGSPDQPTPLLLTVTRAAPDPQGIQLEEVPVAGGIEVRPVADPPEYSTFAWTSGPAGTTECTSAEGYTAYDGQPALIQAADLPSTVCVIAFDVAGVPSAPRSFRVG